MGSLAERQDQSRTQFREGAQLIEDQENGSSKPFTFSGVSFPFLDLVDGDGVSQGKGMVFTKKDR